MNGEILFRTLVNKLKLIVPCTVSIVWEFGKPRNNIQALGIICNVRALIPGGCLTFLKTDGVTGGAGLYDAINQNRLTVILSYNNTYHSQELSMGYFQTLYSRKPVRILK